MPVVKSLDNVDKKAEEFREIGYEYMGEFGIQGRRYLRKGGRNRTHQIHIFAENDSYNINRHLAFREYLRANYGVRHAYAELKKNLANEFHVSLRTICYDIDELARNYPIVTTRGKYKGGVKIADGYRLDRKYLNPKQQHLLKRLSKTLSGEDRNIMESILRDFTLKEASEAAPGC